MQFKHSSHRHAFYLLENDTRYSSEWREIKNVLRGISDESIANHFKENYKKSKSISAAINDLIKIGLEGKGWQSESAIFQDDDYSDNRWRLDFAKKTISIEVAFNHGEAVAWNLIKPNLSGELNHVKKAIQTEIGVVITATEEMRVAGGFDSAVGTYEKYLSYLKPLRHMLTVPVLVIGLKAPKTFRIEHKKVNGRKIGKVKKI